MTLVIVPLVTLLTWILLCAWQGRKVTTTHEFLSAERYLKTRSAPRIFLSTVASYVMIAGYLVFYVTYASLWRGWLVIIPLLSIAAFYLYCFLTLHLRQTFSVTTSSTASVNPKTNQAALIRLLIRSAPDPVTGKFLVAGICWIFIALLTFAMTIEIVYSSKILANVTNDAITAEQFVILLIVSSLLCVVLAGVRGVIHTDIIQFIVLIAFILFLGFDFLSEASSPEPAPPILPDLGTDGYLLLSLFVLNTFLIPYVSLTPWHLTDLGSLQAREEDKPSRMVWRIPFMRGVLFWNLVTLVLVIILLSTDPATSMVYRVFTPQATAAHTLPTLLSACVIIFIICAVLSTVDSNLISHFYHLYWAYRAPESAPNTHITPESAIIQGESSELNESGNEIHIEDEKIELRRTKLWLAFIYVLTFIGTVYLSLFQRGLFDLLVSLGSTVIVLAPWFIKLSIISLRGRDYKESKVFLGTLLILVITNVIVNWLPIEPNMRVIGILIIIGLSILCSVITFRGQVTQ